MDVAFGVQCQRPVDGGYLQLIELDRLRVAFGGEAQVCRTQFGHSGVDFALSLKLSQHSVGIEPDRQWLASQIRDKRLEVSHVQFSLGRPSGFGQGIADFSAQFQRGRAGDLMSELQPIL